MLYPITDSVPLRNGRCYSAALNGYRHESRRFLYYVVDPLKEYRAYIVYVYDIFRKWLLPPMDTPVLEESPELCQPLSLQNHSPRPGPRPGPSPSQCLPWRCRLPSRAFPQIIQLRPPAHAYHSKGSDVIVGRSRGFV
ncbi:hypothetical protein EVAR_77167_1 [Eumeta japonica]|uniref:Uncharacterized protein n=1 Tax=Eumeta variegata TaxID=151549 RepID=A0A4C1T4T7_EUMVA|nr:hypothetical protein EVAR_77167_1 [Eumeta japonica]